MKTSTRTTTENESVIKNALLKISKDPIVKVVLIVASALALLYLAGIVFKIAAGTIYQFKNMSRAIMM